MNLAAASGEGLATTSDIVTDALTAFGLTAKDSGHFADIMAAASSNANTNVAMMGEIFKYCAPVAGALGFSAEDTAEAIGLMANSGIKSSQAGTALRMVVNNLAGDLTFSGEKIGDVVIATKNADGSLRSLKDILADCRVAFSGLSESEQASNAQAVFGTNAMYEETDKFFFAYLMKQVNTYYTITDGMLTPCRKAWIPTFFLAR